MRVSRNVIRARLRLERGLPLPLDLVAALTAEGIVITDLENKYGR